MNDELHRFLIQSHPSVSLEAARQRLPALAKKVRDGRMRILLSAQGEPSMCLVPLEDAALLMEMEHRIDADAGQRAIEAWERNGKRTSPVETLLKRFRLKPRAAAWPVAIADTADPDLSGLTEDHRGIATAIAALGNHFAVMTARRLGLAGEIRGARIEGYRAIFLVEHDRVVLLRIGAGLAQNLLP